MNGHTELLTEPTRNPAASGEPTTICPPSNENVFDYGITYER